VCEPRGKKIAAVAANYRQVARCVSCTRDTFDGCRIRYITVIGLLSILSGPHVRYFLASDTQFANKPVT